MLLRRLFSIILLLLFTGFAALAQPEPDAKLAKPAKKVYKYERQLKKEERLKRRFSKRKQFPEKYRLQILTALAHFPELKDTDIQFRYGQNNFTMVARPKFGSILKKRENRKYQVIINNKKDHDGVLLEHLEFNQQVGIIGHELAHIAYYEDRSVLSLLGNGIAYISKGFRERFEKETDERAIEHGLGWQLHDCTYHCIEVLETSESYKQYSLQYYLTPDEILERLNSSPEK